MPAQASPAPTWRRIVPQICIATLTVLAVTLAIHTAGPASAQTEAPARMFLSPASTTVASGDGPFTIYVVLQELQHFGRVEYDDNRDGEPDRSIESNGLGAFQFTIEYDPAVLEFDVAERGPNLGTTGRSFQCLPARDDPGAVTFGCLSLGAEPPGQQGSFTLASVQFSPRSGGLSPLVLEAEVAGPLGDSAEVEVSGGTVRVTGGATNSNTRTPAPSNDDTPQNPDDVETPGGAATEGPNEGTPPSPQEATATAVAITTREASEAIGGTETALVLGGIQTPGGPGPTTVNEGGDSTSYTWLWSIAIAAGLAFGAAGLTAVLWRRRVSTTY